MVTFVFELLLDHSVLHAHYIANSHRLLHDLHSQAVSNDPVVSNAVT